MKQGFKLSIDKTGKDQGKANYANAFIGFGVQRKKGISSTGRYLEDAQKQGIPVNDQIQADVNTVVFVSVSSEGIYVDQTVDLAKQILRNGGTIIMDKQGTGFGQSHSRFNRYGEGKVHDYLGKPDTSTKEGYSLWIGKKTQEL
ncbi:MAG: hypothetical protein ACFHWX_18745 [Bacteroidota bacterium]